MHAMNIAGMHHRFAHLSNNSRRWTWGSSDNNHYNDEGMADVFSSTDNQCIWCRNPWRCPKQRFLPSTKIPKWYELPDDHLKLHTALQTHDCRMVEHLISIGIKPCSTDGEENCFVLITKYWSSEFLKQMLEKDPAAVHSRGPKGQTLLMYTRDLTIMEVLLTFEPEKHVNSRNSKGKTVLDYLWKDAKSPLTPILIPGLLRAGATIPPVDSHGRTALMQATMKLKVDKDYENVMMALLERGVDVNARDKAGHNAMFHAIKAVHHSIEISNRVAKICFELLKRGSELQGLEIVFKVKPRNVYYEHFEFKYDDRFVALNILSLILCYTYSTEFIFALPDSVLKTVNQNSATSLLTSYLLGRKTMLPVNMDQIDAVVTKFLASDVDVTQSVLRFENKTTRKWSEKLQVPDSICLIVRLLLRICERGSYLRSKKNFQIACKVLVSLLQFWSQPPLALLLFRCKHGNIEDGRFTMLLLNLLARVGGPLLPGSPVFHAVRNMLLVDVEQGNPECYAVQILGRFDKLHANAPSLRDLSRHVVRASLGKTNNVCNLSTKTQEDIEEIPLEVQDFLKFKEQPYFDKDDLPIEFLNILERDQ